MFREIHPEDLIIRTADGSMKVNHSMVKDFGLFNLSQEMQEELLRMYLDNASKRGPKERYIVSTYMRLCKNINAFPFPVITNFTEGHAYDYNMKVLEQFAD